jgi:hypothetical protein
MDAFTVSELVEFHREKLRGAAHVVGSTQRGNDLGMHVWGFKGSIKLGVNGPVDCSDDLQAVDDNRGIDESVFELGVAGKKLRVEKCGVLDVAEYGYVGDMVGGNVLQRNGFDHGRFVRDCGRQIQAGGYWSYSPVDG